MPNDLDSHKQWTRAEWTSNPYMRSVIKFLKEQQIKTFIDAGGCTGEFTNILLETIDTITDGFIIEPIIDNYNYIKTNVKDDRIEVINKALYETSKSINLGRIDNNVGGWSINWGNESNLVECISLEEICSLVSSSIDFIKIDIEGAERDIIENSSFIHEIKFIEIEFHDQYLEPKAWMKFVSDRLPNHKVKYQGDDYCKQNGFLIHG